MTVSKAVLKNLHTHAICAYITSARKGDNTKPPQTGNCKRDDSGGKTGG